MILYAPTVIAYEPSQGFSPRNQAHASVAQLDRASVYETEGRKFKSFRMRQHTRDHDVQPEALLPLLLSAQD